MRIVFLGLSITSSWGNGHATTYRGLVRELTRRGHDVIFFERDVRWYAGLNRDMPNPPYGRTQLYDNLDHLKAKFAPEIQAADFVVIGSFVAEGVGVAEWVFGLRPRATAFYDIDTPVTIQKLERGDYEYLAPHLIRRFDLYMSFNGGPVLDRLERRFGARRAVPLYCSADPELYYPESITQKWDLGYMGTYSDDRQPALDCLLLKPARNAAAARFVVAGPQFPPEIQWPPNVERIEHLPPADHRAFYNSQRFTLNITRAQMVQAGYAPSVRLFEAGACATPVISDWWEGLDSFFKPGEEILVANSPDQTLEYLHETTDADRRAIGRAARKRVLNAHTAAHRAAQLEAYALDILEPPAQNAGINMQGT